MSAEKKQASRPGNARISRRFTSAVRDGGGARTWAEVDLAAIVDNLGVVRDVLAPGTQVIAVVKADAYGHGAVAVAQALVHAPTPAEALAVGDAQEGLELRAAGIDAPIVILGAVIPGEVEAVVAHALSACVHGPNDVLAMESEAKRQGRRASLHLLVDTGMGRLGVAATQVGALLRDIRDAPHVDLEGLATHFSSAAEPARAFTHRQLERFRGAVETARRLGLTPPFIHAANSAGLANYPASRFTAVRPGLALYGYAPRGPAHLPGARRASDLTPGLPMLDCGGGQAGDAARQLTARLRPVLAWRTRVAFLREAVPEGTPVSYDRTAYTAGPTDLAVLPVGYNDGYRRAFSRAGRVLIRGAAAPVVGTITMDYTMVDVGHVPGAAPGDIVTLLGRDGTACLTLSDLARLADTVPYEITCGLGKRVKRRYRVRPGGAFQAPESLAWPPQDSRVRAVCA